MDFIVASNMVVDYYRNQALMRKICLLSGNFPMLLLYICIGSLIRILVFKISVISNGDSTEEERAQVC